MLLASPLFGTRHSVDLTTLKTKHLKNLSALPLPRFSVTCQGGAVSGRSVADRGS